jgi:enoyl-[acyl-carrier protein] reductase III
MSAEFQGKNVLVTGSGRGIGRAIALHFAERGADVIINFFRNRDPAEATAREARAFGGRVMLIKADIGNMDDLGRLFEEVTSSWRGLDMLIHSAASGYNRPAMQQKPKGWDWTMNINARALLFAAQRAVPLMETRGGGWIVSLTSNGSQRVIPNYVAVGASKAALESLTRYLGVELIEKNIRVNAVSPGVVETDALRHFGVPGGGTSIAREFVDLVPARRPVTAEDVAGVVAFLCSPAARMIVGQTIQVDGGYSLTLPRQPGAEAP